ncbi:MAG TPA: IS1380 family transposase [Nitrospiraceae bacterium]|nr:IS1380 family transposase [Nitrospiraceae bacterium]
MIQQTIFPFKIETTKEVLTARSGLALIAEYNHGIGLRELADKHLPTPGSNRGFSPSIFVNSMVLMLQGGGRSFEDLRELKNDEGLMKLIGYDTIPDPDTAGDWTRRMGDSMKDQQGLKGLGEVRDVTNHRIIRRDARGEYTLDVDATGIYGEKADALYTYTGDKGYMPMLGFLYELGICIYDEFREGNVAPAYGHLNLYRECKSRMPKGKTIGRYRADSASYQANLINELDKDKVKWGITADMDQAVKGVITSIPDSEWKEPKEGCGYEIAETVHSMNKTKNAFRLVIKRELRRQGNMFETERYFHHAVATSWTGEEKSALEVLQWHNQRGQAENFNKELKIGFGMERMPCGQTEANAVFFRIGVIAYNLFIGFKRLSCPASWVKHTIATFRWKMIQTAGRIVKHSGSIFLKLAADIEKLELFKGIRKRIFEMTLVLDG